MAENDAAVGFLYGTPAGRTLLKIILRSHTDRLMAGFLRSSLSRPVIKGYAKKHGIRTDREELSSFRSFRDFFIRSRIPAAVDKTPAHLTSPCDAYLSVFPIDEDSCFSIKRSYYRVGDLLASDGKDSASEDSASGDALNPAARFIGGACMILRLTASDYHHYSYIDNGTQGPNHFIEGTLHSVQPIACETFPVYTLNRRSWCLMETENFGTVAQAEIGALVIGGIVNLKENAGFVRGEEKGYFEPAGSSIVLLFEKDRIVLRPELEKALKKNSEVRVRQGMWIGSRCGL